MPLAAILLSHFSARLGGEHPVIRAVWHAAEFLRAHDCEILTSAGMPNWDCSLTAVLEHASPLQMVLPPEISPAFIEQQFSLYDFPAAAAKHRADRDEIIIQNADQIFPIYLRPHGRLAQLLAAIPAQKINRQFDCAIANINASKKYRIIFAEFAPDNFPSDYLWHWTRAPEYIFPDESIRDFWRANFFAFAAPRTGFSALLNILRTRKIYGSNQTIGGREKVVALTENSPVAMLPLLHWRAGRHRMNFEPYAIGFPRRLLIERGARPVNYGGETAWHTMKNFTRWRDENEWRRRGDLIIDDELFSRAYVLVYRNDEIVAAQKFFPGEISILGTT